MRPYARQTVNTYVGGRHTDVYMCSYVRTRNGTDIQLTLEPRDRSSRKKERKKERRRSKENAFKMDKLLMQPMYTVFVCACTLYVTQCNVGALLSTAYLQTLS